MYYVFRNVELDTLPIKNDAEPEVYAAINNDENIRMQSSSGGIFTLLAERVIKKWWCSIWCKFR